MCDFLEDKYLREQVESIEEIGKMITNLKRVGGGLGEFMFDKVIHCVRYKSVLGILRLAQVRHRVRQV